LAGLAVVRDIRDAGRQGFESSEQAVAFESDLLAQFVFARASAGMVDSTIDADISTLESLRQWLGKPLWEMTASDADRYFGKAMRHHAASTKSGRAATIRLFFYFLEHRYKEEIYNLCGCVVECPLDEVNMPRSGGAAVAIRIPPSEGEIERLFAEWRAELATVRRFAPAARDYVVARLMAMIGLRINEARMLDLDDVHPQLGSHGKLHVRYGKGSRGSGPRSRLIPLIGGADAVMTWYVEEVRGAFDDEESWDRPGTALFPAERACVGGRSVRVSTENLRQRITAAATRHLPAWEGRITPHVLRHYCASSLYLAGMNLLAIQELLGHRWVATTMRYVHVHSSHVQDAWAEASQRMEARLRGGTS
jgi:integrase/recombinase XerC